MVNCLGISCPFHKEVGLAKVLILYAAIGSGHQKAAEAIGEAFSRSEGDRPEVILVDVLSLMNPLYRTWVPRGYLWLARRLPWLLGVLYRLTNCSLSLSSPMLFLRSWLSRLLSWGFMASVRNISPQIVICTHFLPVELLFSGKVLEKGVARVLVSVTDLIPHAFWVHPEVSRYFVADEISLLRLSEWGVSPERVGVWGIPVHPSFSVVEKTGISRRDGLLRVLVTGGGGGIAPIEKLLISLSRYYLPVTLLVVCGNNHMLFRRLSRRSKTFPLDLNVKGFVKDMGAAMEWADLVMTKPGGLTTAECLSVGKPMILFSPIPGQEEENQAVLESWGVAVSLGSTEEAPAMLRNFATTQRGHLSDMSRRAYLHGKRNAAAALVRESISMLDESGTHPYLTSDDLRVGAQAVWRMESQKEGA